MPNLDRQPSIPCLCRGKMTVSLLLLLSVLSGVVGALADAGDATWTELDRRVGVGEQCLVCAQPIQGDEIVQIRYKGRTFHVAAGMLETFDQAPETYFEKLEAHSGLFDEDTRRGGQIDRGWALFGLWVVLALVSAALCGYLAIGRGLAPLPWFFAGLAGSVAALVVIFFVPRGSAAVPVGLAKLQLTPQPRPCPHCRATNHPTAAACSRCGGALAAAGRSELAEI